MGKLIVNFLVEVPAERFAAMDAAMAKLRLTVLSREVAGSNGVRITSGAGTPQSDPTRGRKRKHFPSDEEIVSIYKSKKANWFLSEKYDMTVGTIRRIKTNPAPNHRRALEAAGIVIKTVA